MKARTAALLFVTLTLLAQTPAPRAATSSIAALVRDPSGALISGATASVLGATMGAPRTAETDAQGRVRVDDLAPGVYLVTVSADGFLPFEQSVSLADKPIDLTITLKLKPVETSVEVRGRSRLANSDPNYQALRGAPLTHVYQVKNLTLTRDVATLEFRSGSFSFLPPVLGRVAIGVFVGDGNLKLKPAYDIAVEHLKRIAAVDSVDEDFSSLVMYFSDATFDEIQQNSELVDGSLKPHEDALKRMHEDVRYRTEPRFWPASGLSPALNRPLSFLERLLNFDDVPNTEAELLAELYNPSQGGAFRAFIHGKKHAGLRFILNPRGAIPGLPAPEETALLNFDPLTLSDGVWYLSHLATELRARTASSAEEKRLIVPEHYRIEAAISSGYHIGATCDLQFKNIRAGTRVVKFDLFPDLRISRVSVDGRETGYIQENRNKDGSFYLVFPEALVKDRSYHAVFEYDGDQIVRELPRGARGIFPRRAWYPRSSDPVSRATYDLVFKVPRGMTVVSVGKLIKQGREGSADVFEWSSDIPLPIAGFNYYGDLYQKKQVDEQTNAELEVYIDGSSGNPSLLPSREPVLADTTNAVRIFEHWFGPTAYERFAVSQANALDSLPALVFLPAATLVDSGAIYTQRMTMSRGRAPAPPAQMLTFLSDQLSSEVSRQWWGNTVGPSSFHDEWLGRGFANFSVGLYELAVNPTPDEYLKHWKRAHDSLLQANAFGVRPNDAGPVWLGAMNDTYKTPGSAYWLVGAKGGFILHMLRRLMFDSATGDKDFIALMHDYVKTFSNRDASTEDFQWMVEKHMKPAMNLDGNGRMDWFFREWVYGTDVPTYRLEPVVTKRPDGKWLLSAKLAQSGVSDNFKMRVPVYGEFSSKTIRIAAVAVAGNTEGEFKVILSERPKKILVNAQYDVLAK